jgi:elongation factor Ts
VDISADRVKELREKSGAGVMDCKRALQETAGDMDRAMDLLRQQGLSQAAKRAGREASQGTIESYIHGAGRIGVLVEVNCETDFVARTPDFRDLAHDIAMQIAATDPPSVDDEGAAAGDGQVSDPSQLPLLKQPFIKDPSRTIADLVRDTAAKTRENIVVRRFTRFELGA